MGTETATLIDILSQQNTNDVLLVVGTFAAVAVAIGAIVVSSRYQQKQLKLDSLLEVFKLLSTEPAPTHRQIIYSEYRQRLDNIPFASNRDTLRTAQSNTMRDFDSVAALVLEGLIPRKPFLRAYWNIIMLSWNALEERITEERQLRHNASYMSNFQELYKLAAKYKEDNHPNESVEPYSPAPH